VRLPEASQAQPLTTKPRELVISVDEKGKYYIGDQHFSQQEIDKALVKAWTDNQARASVIIRADERCPWKYVVALQNSCIKAKIRDFRATTMDARKGAG
jgi:biopolymer transport protein ExbD